MESAAFVGYHAKQALCLYTSEATGQTAVHPSEDDGQAIVTYRVRMTEVERDRYVEEVLETSIV